MPNFLSAETEPLRRYVYGVLVVVLAFLVTLGVITDEVAFGVGAIASAALLVPAVEVARSRVTPYRPEHGAGEAPEVDETLSA